MRALLTLMLGLWPFALTAQQTLVEVDVELVLAVDVSRSMSPEDLAIQRDGYAQALRSDAVLSVISKGLLGRIAVTYIEWAGRGTERVVVPWTLIATPEDADWVAAQILAHEGSGMPRTSISGGIDFAMEAIETNAFHGLRRVIDVSGDGPNNHGGDVIRARDAALAKGVTINGLPIMTNDAYSLWSIPDLDIYYIHCVIGGPDAFAIPVRQWEEFALAVRQELVLEIAGGPMRLMRAQMGSARHSDYNCRIGEEIRQHNLQIYQEP